MKVFAVAGIILIGMVSQALAQEPFAVVELFASEGCSSCPPADRLLTQITTNAVRAHQRVYTLSFQVDYWNNLGWVDPFSKSEFTQRQYEYSKVLPGQSVYTPQMIVNGQEAFVGSDEARAKASIDAALGNPADVGIKVSAKQTDQGLEVSYMPDRLIPDVVVNVALVEHRVESHPLSGENAGAVITHDNVVRAFKTRDLNETQGRIYIKDILIKNPSTFSVIVYLQDKYNKRIIAANSSNLI